MALARLVGEGSFFIRYSNGSYQINTWPIKEALRLFLTNHYSFHCGPGSSVGIATDYGLDGPGSNPGGDEIFRPSRPALGPTQPPVKWVPGLSRGKVRPGRAADHSPPSSAAVMEEYSYTSTHPLGHTGPVTGSHFIIHFIKNYVNFKVVITVV